MTSPSLSTASLEAAEAPRKSGRGRKRDDTLPYNRNRDVQRAFRARRSAHLENLESRVQELEHENAQLREALDLPPSERAPLGKGPTGRGKPILSRGTSDSAEWRGEAEPTGDFGYDGRSPSPSASESSQVPTSPTRASQYPTSRPVVHSFAPCTDDRALLPTLNLSSNYEFHSSHPAPQSSHGAITTLSGGFSTSPTNPGYEGGSESYPPQPGRRGATTSSRTQPIYRTQDNTDDLGDKHNASCSWGRNAKISDHPLHESSTSRMDGIVRSAPPEPNNLFVKGEWTRTRTEEPHTGTLYIAESLPDQRMNWTSGPPLHNYSTAPDTRRHDVESSAQPAYIHRTRTPGTLQHQRPLAEIGPLISIQLGTGVCIKHRLEVGPPHCVRLQPLISDTGV